jgi:excisionase family DNA binding protein
MRATAIETNPPATECRTMSVTEAARVLGISRTTAYECVRAGDLPSVRLGGRIVVPTQAVDRLLAAGEPASSDE